MSPDLHSQEVGAPQSSTAGPWSSTWVRYYDQHSRRRHKMGGYRRLRELAKRKRRIELIAVAAVGLGVASLVSLFAFILSR